MWSVLIRQLHHVPWKLRLLTFIAVLAAWGANCRDIFQVCLQILETDWKIRKPRETAGEGDAASTLRSFSAACVRSLLDHAQITIPSVLFCYCKPTLGFFLRVSRIALNEDHTKKTMVETSHFNNKNCNFPPTFYWLVIHHLYFGDGPCMKPG